MFKMLVAPTLALSVALAGLAPAPVRAQNDELRRLIVGAGLLALVAAAIHEQRKRDDDDDDSRREVHVYRHASPPERTQAPAAVVRPIPKPERQEQGQQHVYRHPIEVPRNLPASCQRTFKTKRGTATLLTARCLQRSGVWLATLPDRCQRSVEIPGDPNDRVAWGHKCLTRFGYRIQ